MYRNILNGVLLFLVAQTLTFIQLNGQFKLTWFKTNQWAMILMGIPLSFIYLNATKHIVNGFHGLLWPGRFIGFGCGIVTFAIGTTLWFGETVSIKTIISIALSIVLISIQVFWK